MKKDYSIIYIFSFVCLQLVSCKQSTTPSPVVTDGTARAGVTLFDSVSNQIADASGVKVSVEGGSQSAFTDKNGIFSISGLPEGQIPMIFSKPGFAEVHSLVESKPGNAAGNFLIYPLFQINHLTPNIVIRPFEDCYVRYNFRDTQIYSFEAGGHYIHEWVYDSLYEQFGISQFSSRIIDGPNFGSYFHGSVQFFFSNQDSISPNDPATYQYATEQMGVDAYNGIGTIDIYRDSLLHHGFSANSTIKCTAFATGLRTQGIFYTDKATGKKIYTGLSPFHSIAASFTLP